MKFKINDKNISNTNENYQFLELIIKGKINLYYGYNNGFLYKKKKKIIFSNKTNLYFCKKENKINPTLVYATTDKQTNSDYAKIARNYFSDNLELKKKDNR